MVEIPSNVRDHLASADPVMGEIVERVGSLEYRVEPDLWKALVGSIVGQQLSVAAARTIRGRVAALGERGFPEPAELLKLSDETLRGCGLSRAKVSYVRDVADRFDSGDIDAARVAEMDDEEVIDELTRIRGVGRWTAEMVLTFSLNRPDVFATDDLGIRNAVQKAYGLDDRPAGPEMLEIAEPWRPHRSAASLYLWRSLA